MTTKHLSRKLLVLATLAGLAAADPAGAASSKVVQERGAGSTADAYWEYQESACISTYAEVEAVDAVGSGGSFSYVFLSFFRVDNCSGTNLTDINSFTDLADTNFAVSPDGRYATLVASVSVLNNATDPATPLDVSLRLTWSASGKTARTHGSFHSTSSPGHGFFGRLGHSKRRKLGWDCRERPDELAAAASDLSADPRGQLRRALQVLTSRLRVRAARCSLFPPAKATSPSCSFGSRLSKTCTGCAAAACARRRWRPRPKG